MAGILYDVVSLELTVYLLVSEALMRRAKDFSIFDFLITCTIYFILERD